MVSLQRSLSWGITALGVVALVGLATVLTAAQPDSIDGFLARPSSHIFLALLAAAIVGGVFILLQLVRQASRNADVLGARLSEATTELNRALFELALSQRRAEATAATQQLLEEQLRQSQKLETVGQLAGGIAHDFNNLLTVIRGHSELLASAIDEADPRQQGILQIHEASRRAAALTRQLLAFTRKQELQPRLLDANDALEQLFPMLQRLIGEDVEVSLHLARETTMIMADAGQLDQVITNLVVNARDAMPRGGTIVLTTDNVELDGAYALQHEPTVPGSYVMIAVSDTGTGMNETTRARIFEPFFTTKPAGRGCGLGLSTVYGIVKQSGGYIWVYSELGRGTTFKVYLPHATATAGAPASPDVPETRLPGGTETVLLVEDDHALRSLGRQILARQGYTVLDAVNGRDALHLGTRHEGRIDLLITDMVMPELGGDAVAERLTAARPRLRTLYMSGYTDHDIIRRGMLGPHDAFIQKPFTAAGLLQAVRDVLDHDLPVVSSPS